MTVRALRVSLVFTTLLAPPLAIAEPTQACFDSLGQDRQLDFSSYDLSASGVSIAGPQEIRLNPHLGQVDPERIILPVDQPLSVSFVSENASASHALGWLYYDDLITRGYVDLQDPANPFDDTLRDTNANGIVDLHEDLYNLAPPSGVSSRPYIGTARRCTRTFISNGLMYSEPELALKGCVPTYAQGSFIDARPNRGGTYLAYSVGMTTTSTQAPTDFSDQGLYPRVPNLLEPADPLNAHRGLGHLAFLLSDDDSGLTTYGNLGVVADRSGSNDGLPDYPASQYDANGRLRPGGSATAPITAADRTVSLGTVEGNREIVFFLVTFFDSTNSAAHPCLRFDATGRCNLYLKTPVSVFFSKGLLNLDQNAAPDDPVLLMNMQAWLEPNTLSRLSSPVFNLPLPSQPAVVFRPTNGRMPHAAFGMPSTDPTRWVMGFEDENGGGDRDFNDVVFVVSRELKGGVRSATLSEDISPSVAEDFSVSRVLFRKDDAPATEATSGACAIGAPPRIDYEIATDCRLCSQGVCTPNASPSWVKVPLPPGGGMAQVDMDLTGVGPAGSQLCWRATLTSSHPACTPVVRDVDVRYQAVRAGNVGTTSIVPLGNAFLQGLSERVGSGTSPAPSRRKYDGQLDRSARGHLLLQQLHAPETPGITQVFPWWDAGQTLASLITNSEPFSRPLFTTGASPGVRRYLVQELAESNTSSIAFNTSTLCSAANASTYDLNRNGICDAADRGFLRDWLQGYEERGSTSSRRRAWVLGALPSSRPSVVGVPGTPAWLPYASPEEQERYLAYADTLAYRSTLAYVASSSGFLHGFDVGRLLPGDDPCTPAVETQGYFESSSGCGSPRLMGDGAERVAYAPGKLLPAYVQDYVSPSSTPLLEGTPAVAEVDLGGTSLPWTPATSPGGAGAQTVLVGATGRAHGSVFALDVTRPDDAAYPAPLWEYSLSTVLGWSWPTASRPDTRGTRHTPVVARLETGTLAPRWTAIVATDFLPANGDSGALYLLDVRNGQPLTGASPSLPVGIIPLLPGEGIASEPIAVDTDFNGSDDVLYVATTDGSLFRVNLRAMNANAPLGSAFSVCRVAHVPTDLMTRVGWIDWRQRFHSQLAARVEPTEAGEPKVHLFLTTGDNPDVDDSVNDTPPESSYVLAYEDSHPAALPSDCGTSPATLRWSVPLPPGERSWGGVTLDGDNVYLATAVGPSLAPCGLSATQGGSVLSLRQVDGSLLEWQWLDAHFPSAPVVHEGRVIVVSADGRLWIRDGNGWAMH